MPEEFIKLRNGFIAVVFKDLSDKEVDARPWVISKFFFFMHPWEPNFNVEKFKFTTVRVWVRLPELPLEYFEEKTLSWLTLSIGKFIKADECTQNFQKA